MNKIAIILATLIIISACKDSGQKEALDKSNLQETAVENSKAKETLNKEVPYEDEETVMLLGKINKEGLKKEPYAEWFVPTYEAQELDTSTIEKIKPLLDGVSIKIFMGTWCEDSQREIPHFYKMYEALNGDPDKLEIIAMTDIKETPQNYEKGLDIEYVPTIIFYKDGKELDRYVEYAQESLEEDVYAILSGEDYKHSYEE